MLKNFTLDGYWKLPEHENFHIAGTLSFDTETGIKISLLRNLCCQEYCRGPHEYEFIHGCTLDGKYITLYNCHGNDHYPIPGFPSSDYFAKYIFIGVILYSLNELEIRTSSIHYSYLDEWVGKSGFGQAFTSPNEGYFAQIKYKHPDPIIIHEDLDRKILLWFAVRYSPRKFESSIKQTVYLNINFSNASSFDALTLLATQFRNFLSLGTSRRCVFTHFSLNHENTYNGAIEVYFINKVSSKIDDFAPASSMLFSLTDIENDITKIYGMWLAKHETLLPVFQLYFDTIDNVNLYKENTFLNLISALETYGRRANPSTELLAEEFLELKNNLLGTVSNKHHDWLQNKLQFMNEISLRKRLKIIFKEFDDIIKLFKNEISIGMIVNTRNYLVHFDESLKGQIIHSNKFHNYNRKLFFILQMCILKEIGFGNDEILSFLKRFISTDQN